MGDKADDLAGAFKAGADAAINSHINPSAIRALDNEERNAWWAGYGWAENHLDELKARTEEAAALHIQHTYPELFED